MMQLMAGMLGVKQIVTIRSENRILIALEFKDGWVSFLLSYDSDAITEKNGRYKQIKKGRVQMGKD